MTTKYTVPDERQMAILRKNEIGTEHIVVVTSDNDHIRVLNHQTRCVITVHRGDSKW